ncbi:MAG: recombination mediator RecR [Patescibacteria group bacterium]|nr:recombination mediator RecR [Patescibacteria group bacterium]MDD5490541.1 recombination mediator RecR [Patescibacteria group bacterium]
MRFPKVIQNLIDQFNKLPGIGPKTSERLVFYLLKRPREELKEFAEALEKVSNATTVCSICYNFTETNPCEICSDKKRDKNIICVVAEIFDLLAIENTGEYNGLYHVLGGNLNPIEGITPDELTIKQLLARLSKNGFREIILALNPDIEGESTTLYLSKILKPYKIKITRLARGLPMGSNLEYADEITISNALKGRMEI